jgi:hypothetical protein
MCERILRRLAYQLSTICSLSQDASNAADGAAGLTAAQVSNLRKCCSESLAVVHGALARAATAAEACAPVASTAAASAQLTPGRTRAKQKARPWRDPIEPATGEGAGEDGVDPFPDACTPRLQPRARAGAFSAHIASPHTGCGRARTASSGAAAHLASTHSWDPAVAAAQLRSGGALRNTDALQPSPLKSVGTASSAGVEETESVGTGVCTTLSGADWAHAEGVLAELPARLANAALLLKVHIWPALTTLPRKGKASMQAEIEAVGAVAAEAAIALTAAQHGQGQGCKNAPLYSGRMSSNAHWMPRHLACQHVAQRGRWRDAAEQPSANAPRASAAKRSPREHETNAHATAPGTETAATASTERAHSRPVRRSAPHSHQKRPTWVSPCSAASDADEASSPASPRMPRGPAGGHTSPPDVQTFRLQAMQCGLVKAARLARDSQAATQGVLARLRSVVQQHADQCGERAESAVAALLKVAAAADALAAKPCETTVKQLVRSALQNRTANRACLSRTIKAGFACGSCRIVVGSTAVAASGATDIQLTAHWRALLQIAAVQSNREHLSAAVHLLATDGEAAFGASGHADAEISKLAASIDSVFEEHMAGIDDADEHALTGPQPHTASVLDDA